MHMKDVQPDKKQNYMDECERVEVERRFSLAKRCCGLGLITAGRKETACHCMAMSILLLNLGKIQCALWAFWLWLLTLPGETKKPVVVQ